MVKITEYQFQKLVVDWLDASLPKGCFYHHSPNEGKRHVNYMVKMKNNMKNMVNTKHVNIVTD